MNEQNQFCSSDLIKFERPKIDRTLFLNNISSDTTKDDLTEIFQPFGLLAEVFVFTPPNKSSFGMIKYYSKRAALNAKQSVFGCVLHGHKIQITFSKKETSSPNNSLTIAQCNELANYYIGFDKWSSTILGLNQTEFNEEEKDGALSVSCTYECEVKISVSDGSFVTGYGTGHQVGKSRSLVVENGIKIAVTNAKKAAFGKINILLFDSGEVQLQLQGEEPTKEPVTDQDLLNDILGGNVDFRSDSVQTEETYNSDEDASEIQPFPQNLTITNRSFKDSNLR